MLRTQIFPFGGPDMTTHIGLHTSNALTASIQRDGGSGRRPERAYSVKIAEYVRGFGRDMVRE